MNLKADLDETALSGTGHVRLVHLTAQKGGTFMTYFLLCSFHYVKYIGKWSGGRRTHPKKL
jgi:hypothetical protein